MDRGSYNISSAGMVHLTKLDMVNNNLANLSTPGFKGQYLVTRKSEFDDTLAAEAASGDPYARGDHDRTPGITTVEAVTDFSVGPIQSTGNPLNVALRKPNEFFVVNTPEGTMYTRAGNFTLDAGGRLVTSDGSPLQTDAGEVTINTGVPTITSGGIVRVDGIPGVLGVPVGRLQVVEIDQPELMERVGANKFKIGGAGAPQTVAEPSVVPSSLEGANVSAVQAIVELIAASRGFEMYTKSASSIDQINTTAIQRLGKMTA